VSIFVHFFTSEKLFIRASGVGNYGAEGIQKYVKDHRCQSICTALGLPPARYRTADQAHQQQMEGAQEDEEGSEPSSDELGGSQGGGDGQ
jgi:hypothetical protein